MLLPRGFAWIAILLDACRALRFGNSDQPPAYSLISQLTDSIPFGLGNSTYFIGIPWIGREGFNTNKMAAIHQAETGFHSGEQEMHRLLKVPQRDNPTSTFVTPFATNIFRQSPLVALGTLDADGRPWTTLWGGEPGFLRAMSQSILGLKTTVEKTFDPVVDTLFGGRADGEVIQQENGPGKMISGLAIDLENRKRVKLYGRFAAGALASTQEGIGEVQLVLRIEQTLGNCPKYLNKKHIIPHIPKPKLVRTTFPLPQGALNLMTNSDLFFMSSSHHDSDMDTNHRGGPQGFVRVLSNDEDGLTFIYPEYSGNRLYQTLGNLVETPQAGFVFPDFSTGDVLYLTGTTEILTGKQASSLLSHTNLAIKIKVSAFKYVTDGLAFRGQNGEFSPYNPPVRYLYTEQKLSIDSASATQAKLISREILSPSIARFRFQLSEKSTSWKPGQYVALSFEDELDIGYSHMRDDDPRSLNDDYLRTFTVSSRPDSSGKFEITCRKNGPVTQHLFRHNMKMDLEVPITGFGGEFYILQGDEEKVAFIAAGVGITPLLAQAADLDITRLSLYWTVKEQDLGFVSDTFGRVPGLAAAATLFVTGGARENIESWKEVQEPGVKVLCRRVAKDDLIRDPAKRWYFCTGVALKKMLLQWLDELELPILYEDFDY